MSPYSEFDISCKYTGINDYIKNEKKLSILSLNIQSLSSKFSELSELLNELESTKSQPDLICLQEVWQIHNISSFNLPNYHPLEINLRNAARGGGVGIYVHNSLSFKPLPHYSIFVDRILETLFLEISLPDNNKFIIGSIYRPGTKFPGLNFSSQFSQFSELLTNTLSELSNTYENVFVYGDFNLDLLKSSENKYITEYIDNIFSLGFLQLILKPTRISTNAATLIDHILTNSTLLSHEIHLLCSKISDHFPIIHHLNFTKSKVLKTEPLVRNFSKTSISRFKKALTGYNWNHILTSNCAENSYTEFSNTFTNIFNIYFPLIQPKTNKNFNPREPWMSSGILTSRRNKNFLCNICIKNPSPENISKFKTFRNLYNSVIRKAKKLNLEKQLENCKNDLRKTWKILYTSIRKNTNKKLDCTRLIKDDLSTDDPCQMAEIFNAHFTNMASETIKNLNPSFLNPTSGIVQNPDKLNFTTNPLTKSEILEATDLLMDKKTPDLNGISSNFLKQIIRTIINPIHHIFSLSLNSGIFPSQLKIAKVVPIFKSGDKCNPDNYRPISLINTFSKILEKVVARRVSIFLNNSNLLSKWQFGFRRDHSTTHPMIHFMNFITSSLNEKKYTIAIFCDLKKAFDTCNHKILLLKLAKYGINDTELKWFESYLSNRQQFVTIHEKSSRLLPIKLGVPQGSILGPLLFLIYINDLPIHTKLFSLLFADDTTLLASHDNLTTLTDFVNSEFRRLCNFFRANGLVLHPEKTKFMIFSRSKNITNPSLFTNNNNNDQNNPDLIHEIGRVSDISTTPAIKFLGVFFDENLNFKYHISTLRKKLSGALYSLRLVKNTLSTSSLKLLYNSIFHCHLIYAISIWSSANNSLINMLFKLQKNAIRIISQAPYNSHTEPLFKKHEILPLPDLIHFSKIQFMQRFKNNFLPTSFEDTWTLNNIRNIGENEIRLRNYNQLQLHNSQLTTLNNHPLYLFPRIWENFKEEQIKIIRKRPEFDEKLKKYFLHDLSSVITCNRLFCPSCSNVGGAHV